MKAVLLLSLLAFPDERKTVEAVCPADGARFEAVEIVSSNTWGGVDADFCPHAFKTAPLEFRVWVCPSCAFAGRQEDFGKPVSAEEKDALAAEQKDLDRESLAGIRYLAGELHRRKGDFKGASAWYRKALDTTENESLRKQVNQQKSRLTP